ncbi:MAG: hypothetical protein IKL13_06530 [Clostridia bacterium]|nr:hypothetical protein [Clostridia bacterium]
MLELLIAREPDKLQEFQEEHFATERIHQLTEENKKYAPMRNGINSYLSLDLSLLGPVKKRFIKKIVLGPKCTQNIEELSTFLNSHGFSTTIEKSNIEIR